MDFLSLKTPFWLFPSSTLYSLELPVSVKFRSGWDENNINAVEFAEMQENAGASVITIHGRTRKQMYAPPVNFDIIREVKEAVKIPVIGNGGIKDASLVKEFLQAGCAGVMIGRGAVGNPFIFQDIIEELSGRKPVSQDPKKRLEIYLRLVKENAAFYGERIGVNRSRKTAGYWIKDFPNASEVRGKFVRMDSLAEIEALFAETVAGF